MLKKIWNHIPLQLRRRIGIGEKLARFKELKKIREIVRYYKKSDDEEIRECINYIRQNKKVDVFNYEFTSEYKPEKIVIEKDISCDMFYYEYYGKKMYLKKSLTEHEAKVYVNSILMEQDWRSPHKYLTPDIVIDKDDIVFDVGAAEGNFSLFILDRVKKIVLFESDNEWIEALQKTFENYEGKCLIVNRFVGKRNVENELSLDDFVHDTGIIPTIIKMDIEGGELPAIEGSINIIANSARLKMFLCTYHSFDAEEKMREKLQDTYDIEMSSGYMVWTYVDGWKPPYFKRGILRAIKKIQ